MSKFDCGAFYGGYDDFAANAEKYSKDEAIWMYIKEGISDRLPITDRLNAKLETPILVSIGQFFVRHRAGRNEDNEPCVGWWIEYEQYQRSCPAWVFHLLPSTNDAINWNLEKKYEIIDLRKWLCEHNEDKEV